MIKDHTGTKFGKTIVIGRSHVNQNSWEVLCDCGKINPSVTISQLSSHKSCGCINYSKSPTEVSYKILWKRYSSSN